MPEPEPGSGGQSTRSRLTCRQAQPPKPFVFLFAQPAPFLQSVRRDPVRVFKNRSAFLHGQSYLSLLTMRDPLGFPDIWKS